MPFCSDNPEGLPQLGRRGRSGRSTAYQVTVALILIAFGTILFLDNVGVLPLRWVYQYWPAIFIALGLAKLVYKPSAVSVLWSFFLIIAGSVFLLVNLDIVHIRNDGTWPLALVFICIGFLALVRTVDQRPLGWRRRRRVAGFVPWSGTDAMNENVVLGSLKRRVESTNFMGGEIHAVLGSIELDLRAAQLPPGAKSATVEVECVMASVEIRVPETWRVSVQAEGVLGNIEDRTIPPRPDPGLDPPTLVIRGSSVMGTVELEN
ncbi:MAG TPA: DUF5668 domain-containing protein [Bryobacteraceae bacterium]|nr:DUF5668 domain-containing protein [Bryobacteraceae bacterium]